MMLRTFEGVLCRTEQTNLDSAYTNVLLYQLSSLWNRISFFTLDKLPTQLDVKQDTVDRSRSDLLWL